MKFQTDTLKTISRPPPSSGVQNKELIYFKKKLNNIDLFDCNNNCSQCLNKFGISNYKAIYPPTQRNE